MAEADVPSTLAADAPQQAFLMVATQQAEDARIAEEARVAEEAAAAQAAADAAAARQKAIQAAPAPSPPPVAASPAPYTGGIHAQPFLVCVRRHESDRSDVNGDGLYDGGYQAQNPGSSAAGAYQFLTSTWNSVVNQMGHPEWGGVASAYPEDVQDQVAWWTYTTQGPGPWAGSGCY